MAWTKTLPDQESRIGRALAGGHLPSLAKAVAGHEQLCQLVFSLFLDQIDAECSTLCRRCEEPPSLFRKIPVASMGDFQWSCCIDELRAKTPLLLQILTKIVCHSDSRNKKKVDSAHFPSVCMAVATILKERNREMCGVQSLLSLLLFASRVDKQVVTIIHVLL